MATAGTAVQLSTTPTAIISVNVQAETDNTGLIAVGGSSVDATATSQEGTILSAGQSTQLAIDDLSIIYIDSTVNGDGVTYTYLTV